MDTFGRCCALTTLGCKTDTATAASDTALSLAMAILLPESENTIWEAWEGSSRNGVSRSRTSSQLGFSMACSSDMCQQPP